MTSTEAERDGGASRPSEASNSKPAPEMLERIRLS